VVIVNAVNRKERKKRGELHGRVMELVLAVLVGLLLRRAVDHLLARALLHPLAQVHGLRPHRHHVRGAGRSRAVHVSGIEELPLLLRLHAVGQQGQMLGGREGTISFETGEGDKSWRMAVFAGRGLSAQCTLAVATLFWTSTRNLLRLKPPEGFWCLFSSGTSIDNISSSPPPSSRTAI
jgi:hypothetical protein